MLIARTLASRVFLSHVITKRFVIFPTSFSSLNSYSYLPPDFVPLAESNSREISLSFKDWFKSREDAVLDRIFEILTTKEDDSASTRATELELSKLGLRLHERFVLKVLHHGSDVLSCLKFFDWAGRQQGYNHTRATFNAIFKILSRAKLMSLMLDFLKNYSSQRQLHKVRFNDTLVMGYAVAGKPDVALQLFGKMRFQGLDLDAFTYHILLNALVEEGYFDAVEMILNQIRIRGFTSEITACIRMKNLCKQSRLEDGEALLREMESNGDEIDDYTVAVLVDEYCKKKKFEEVGRLVEGFPSKYTYGVLIRDLVHAGNVDGAMDFLRSKKLLEGYIPEVYRYNILICRLLREGRLEDVCDLLMEMREEKISPDKVTMNAALRFFCKAGMIDVALELYSSREDFGLSLNSLTYNYLINTLCGDGSVDDAYQVLKDSIEKGYFLGKRTFTVLVGALYREGKIEKMTELVNVALERKIMPSDAVCLKFISALCKARRVEDGYLIYGELNRMHKVTNRFTFIDLIRGFNRSNRGDMASRLLIEMQENGLTPDRKLYRAVIHSVCRMENPENQFFKLLEMQLSHHEHNCDIYNFFIDGAGHARRPDLATKVYEIMASSEVPPNSTTNILMLQSYLKGDRIADAINFYDSLCETTSPEKKLYNTMIVGLCKAKKPDLAQGYLTAVRAKGLIPSLECYEELVRSFAADKAYPKVAEVISDLGKTGRRVSSFIGNILLLHSWKDREFYHSWLDSGTMSEEPDPSDPYTLEGLVRIFSGGLRVEKHLEDLDSVIEKCFPLDIFTYNMLLRRLSMAKKMDKVFEMYGRLRKKGYEPNQWTYDIIIQGLCRSDRRYEAKKWVDEMYRKGFDPSNSTRELI